MNKLIAMTTAASLALSCAAFAQDAQEETQPEAEATTAPQAPSDDSDASAPADAEPDADAAVTAPVEEPAGQPDMTDTDGTAANPPASERSLGDDPAETEPAQAEDRPDETEAPDPDGEPAEEAMSEPASAPVETAAPRPAPALPEGGEGTVETKAAQAGITSMNGEDVDPTSEPEITLAEIDEPVTAEQALQKAREQFAQADSDGDESLSVNEFIDMMRPVADALEAENEPLMGEVMPEEAAPETETADAALTTEDAPADTELQEDGAAATDETETAAAAATEETATAEAEVEPEMRELEPSDYLTTKFETISGVDGALSLTEMEAAHAADFEEADANGDDALDAAEAETFATLSTGRMTY